MLLKKLVDSSAFLPHISEEIWCNLDTEELHKSKVAKSKKH